MYVCQVLGKVKTALVVITVVFVFLQAIKWQQRSIIDIDVEAEVDQGVVIEKCGQSFVVPAEKLED